MSGHPLPSFEENIKVCVRVRPLLRDELAGNGDIAWAWDQNVISLEKPSSGNANRKSSIIGTTGRNTEDSSQGSSTSYCFDHLFKPEHSNERIFSSVVKNVVRQSMEGFHGSVFTYGQTSSGKTFTMNGTADDLGIIPHSIHHCFELIQHFPDREFLFRISYLEVYNEQVNDLLSTEPSVVKIQHGPKVGTVLSGVKEQIVQNPEQVFQLLRAGEAHRHVGSTDMNEKSSRAHTLFKMIIESKQCNVSDNTVRVSTLSLVDLAVRKLFMFSP